MQASGLRIWPKESAEDGAVTFVGMDLGTFKTSVVSSNGRREQLQTIVGWPKDPVARSVLGRDVVFGKEVVERQLALDVVRPFAKGALKYGSPPAEEASNEQWEKQKKAARLLVQHAVSQTDPPGDTPLFGVVGVPSRASVGNKQVILDAVRETFHAAMLVAEPFAVAYGMNTCVDTLVVDIGAGTIDICPMFGAFPKVEDQITIPLGGDVIDEDFRRRVGDAFPKARMSLTMAREIKEKSGFVHDVNEEVVATLTVEGRPEQFDVTDHLKQSCLAIVEPILRGVAELISRFDPEIQQALFKNVLLAGGGSQLKGLDQLVEQGLEPYGGAKVSKVYDSVFAGAAGALKVAMGMPAESWQKMGSVRRAAPALRSDIA